MPLQIHATPCNPQYLHYIGRSWYYQLNGVVFCKVYLLESKMVDLVLPKLSMSSLLDSNSDQCHSHQCICKIFHVWENCRALVDRSDLHSSLSVCVPPEFAPHGDDDREQLTIMFATSSSSARLATYQWYNSPGIRFNSCTSCRL